MDETSAPWARLFALPNDTSLPIHVRLRTVVVQAILDGRLSPGMALPSSRDLAQALSLGRNTVITAYEQLVDNGYLETRPRRGVFVSSNARPSQPDMTAGMHENPFLSHATTTSRPTQAPPNWRSRVLRSHMKTSTLSKPTAWSNYPYQFVYGTHDPELFPTDDFRECCIRSLSRQQQPLWAPDLEKVDVEMLVEQVRQRLLPKRGVFALADEILITIGSQHAFYLLAEALFDHTTRLGLEEPGHPHARNSFSMRDPKIINIAVDDNGLVVDAMPTVDYVFVTPSHQSPTTRTLSLERRQWLLRKAELQNFIIIEDDYEAENLYAGTPMPALKSMDTTGRVIYIGSLSKSLSPALRLGYIVAPRELIAELRVLRHAQIRHPSAFLQHAYALFLSLGHHDSHVRRVNQIMQERIAKVGEALRLHLPDFSFAPPQGGASVWVRGPDWLDASELADVARRHGVLIEAGNVFYDQPPYPCPSFRLRLSSILGSQIDAGIQTLSLAVNELAQARDAENFKLVVC